MLRTYENSLIEPVLGQMPAVPALTSNSPLLRCSAPFTNLAGGVEALKLRSEPVQIGHVKNLVNIRSSSTLNSTSWSSACLYVKGIPTPLDIL